MLTVKVEYSVDVQARAEKLWDILTNVQSWPEWQGTSYMKTAEADLLKEGSTFIAELGGIRWNIKVLKANKPFSICWTGKRLGIKAIHEWEFQEDGEKTRAITRESMSGGVLILLYPIIKRRLLKYDYKWLIDLKSKAENR